MQIDTNLFSTYIDKIKVRIGTIIVFYRKRDEYLSINVVKSITPTLIICYDVTYKKESYYTNFSANSFKGRLDDAPFLYRVM